MSFSFAGKQMPPLEVCDVNLPEFVQDWRAYAISGPMPYARDGQTVLCIIGDGKNVNALWPIFKRAHANLPYTYERRQLYLEAEGGGPQLGFIAKSTGADPNDVMPFFHLWGIHLTWAKTAWNPK